MAGLHIEQYSGAWAAAAFVAFLFFVQTLVGLGARVRARHPGGMPIAADRASFLFRADRARANTIELLGAFTLLLFLATSAGAEPVLVNVGAGVFAAGRLAHMLAYYANRERPRIASFVAGNFGLMALLASVVLVFARSA